VQSARSTLWFLLLAALGCDRSSPADVPDATAADAPAADAAVDDVPAGPLFSFAVGDDEGTVTVHGMPLRIALGGPTGPQLASPASLAFLQLGLRPGGPSATRFHDPRRPDPAGIEWVTPRRATAVDEAQGSITLDDPRTGPVTVRVTVAAPGVVAIDLDARGPDVAMLRLVLPTDDGAYRGLGERFGPLDPRGSIVPMQLQLTAASSSGTNETHVPVPFVVSSRGYGLFVRTREAGAFDVGATAPAELRASFEGHRATAFVLMDARRDPTAVVARYTRLTGLPRLPPRWAFGPQQWRNVWRNADELLEDARRLRAERIPTTTLWIDNPWMRSYVEHVVDEARFPDPPGLLRTLAGLGYRVLFWSVPYLDAVAEGSMPRNEAERQWLRARDAGWLVRGPTGTAYVSPSTFGSPGGMREALGSLVDFTSRDASAYWTEQLGPLIQMGARAFKLDYGEDIVTDVGGARPRFAFSTGESERTARWAYPQGYHAAYRAALDRYAGGDGFLLGRASSWGGQSVLDVVWPGDLDNDFRAHVYEREVGGLPASVHALISLAESGFPNFASDTGGYRGGRPTREALLRWAEHTALSPFLQLGGGGESHNPWTYEPDATPVYRDLARLHNTLVPYLFAQARRASRDGTPPVRSLALAFPDDAAGHIDDAAYLLGDDLYVAAVVTPDTATRRVHVPPGTWVHWWSQRAYTGPADVEVPAPIGQPAFFVRRGAGIELLPDDLDTLVDATAPGIVDGRARADRRTLRVWTDGPRRYPLEDGGAVELTPAPVGWTATVTRGGPVQRLHLAVDARSPSEADPARATPLRLTTEGYTADARAATDGCTDCWHWDAPRATLHVVVTRDGPLAAAPR
jgi:alpha-glucosidase (family GH31 glycosyl hydrolase)